MKNEKGKKKRYWKKPRIVTKKDLSPHLAPCAKADELSCEGGPLATSY